MTSRNPHKVARRLASASRKQAEHSAQRHRTAHIGTILELSPITVEVHDLPHVLTHGINLRISQWVWFYHQIHGIEVDDNLLIDFRHGHYIAHDVLSDKDMSHTATLNVTHADTASAVG